MLIAFRVFVVRLQAFMSVRLRSPTPKMVRRWDESCQKFLSLIENA